MRCKRRELGFTLIEFILVAVIISVISVVMGRFLIQAYQSFTTSNYISQIDDESTMALMRIVNDIHNIRSSADITTMSASALSFIDVNGNSIQYSVSGANLLRTGIVLIDNLSSLTFSYYDANGNVTTANTALAYVQISLGVTNGTITQTFSTAAGRKNI